MQCLDECPRGKFGVECAGTCVCEHGGECSPANGSCTCKPGWSGTRCERRACPDGMFGPRCDRRCDCHAPTTELCDPWTGACECAAGWGGETCERQCPLLTFGKGCQNPCRCENDAQCSPVNGMLAMSHVSTTWSNALYIVTRATLIFLVNCKGIFDG